MKEPGSSVEHRVAFQSFTLLRIQPRGENLLISPFLTLVLLSSHSHFSCGSALTRTHPHRKEALVRPHPVLIRAQSHTETHNSNFLRVPPHEVSLLVWCTLTWELEPLSLPSCLCLSDLCVCLCAWCWGKAVTGFPFVGVWLLSSEVQSSLLKCHSRASVAVRQVELKPLWVWGTSGSAALTQTDRGTTDQKHLWKRGIPETVE